MKYLKLYFFTLTIMAFSSSIYAQSIKRQSVNNIGGNGKVGSISIHHTGGQPYSTKSYSGEHSIN